MTTKTVENKHGVEVGDFYVCSWGYDQTSVSFYRVVRVTATKAEIVPVTSRVVSSSTGSDSVVPGSDERPFDVLIGINRDSERRSKLCTVTTGWRGQPTLVLQSGQYWASKWEGAPMHETASGWGH